MTHAPLLVSRFDKERLERKIEQVRTRAFRDKSDRELTYANHLAVELAKARVVEPGDVPPDIVTMNSTVELVDVETGRVLTYTLAFPADSDPAEGRISILAPVGTALLGARAGDIVEWPVPRGVCRYRVNAVVYQPEAAGDDAY